MLRYRVNSDLPSRLARLPLWRPTSQLRSLYTGTAPPGKHELSECEAFEAEWRCKAADTIGVIIKGRRVFIWCEGPVETAALLDVMKYVCSYEQPLAYHMPEVTFVDPSGYIESWIAFEATLALLNRLFSDPEIDFESVRLYGLAPSGSPSKTILRTPFWKLEADAIGEDWIVIASDAHFEGCLVAGTESVIVDVGLQLDRSGARKG